MSLTTYGGLKASYASWATRSDLDNLDDFAFWAHQEICRRLRANVLLSTADVVVGGDSGTGLNLLFQSELGGEGATLPEGFLALKRCYLDTSPRITLNVISPEMAAERCAMYSTVEYPDSLALEGGEFHLAPLFSGAATGKMLYYKEPLILVNDGDTNVVLAKYPYLYLYGGLEALYQFLEDDNNADRFGQRFGALLDDINSRDAKDSMSGPIQTASYPGGVV